jgi:DNA-binding NtrC family response regulator
MARVELAIADPASRLTLKAMLEAEGHTATEAEPDVVICDDLRTAVLRAPERPVLALTPYSEVRDAVTAMRQGVYGYILLPFQPGEAAVMVERALGQNRPASEQTVPEKLEVVEGRHIQEVVRLCKGNRAEAARVLGIGRNTLWRKLKKMGSTEPGEPEEMEEDEGPTE